MIKRMLLVLVIVGVANATTWYVRASGGNDANNGTAHATAFATIQVGLDSAKSLDTIRLCGDLFTETKTDSVDMNGGLHTAPDKDGRVLVIGCDADGTPKTGTNKTKITTSATLADGLIYVVAPYWSWQNIEFNGGGLGKAEFCINTVADNAYGHQFSNSRICKADDAGVNYRIYNSNETAWMFTNCEIDSNGLNGTGDGFNLTSPSRGNLTLIGCLVHDNAGNGVEVGGSVVLWAVRSAFYDNGGDGYQVQTGSAWVLIDGCVAFSNGGDGFEFPNVDMCISFTNNISRSNTGYGVKTNTLAAGAKYYYQWSDNCVSNNTAGAIDAFGGTFPGAGTVTADPLFVSEADGAENFQLQAASPCKNTGYGAVGY